MLGQETPILGDFFHAEMLGVFLLATRCVFFRFHRENKGFLGGGSLIGIEYTPRNWTWIPKMMVRKGIERVTPLRYGYCGYLYVKL